MHDYPTSFSFKSETNKQTKHCGKKGSKPAKAQRHESQLNWVKQEKQKQ